MKKIFPPRQTLIQRLCLSGSLLLSACAFIEADETPVLSKRASGESTLKVSVANGRTATSTCWQETRPSGEIIQICVPENWNRQLILYAHGYVSEFEPLRLPADAAPFVALTTGLGFAFATTSFSENGLAIQKGIEEIRELKKTFTEKYGSPAVTYLTGASQGGIITTLAVERFPTEFNGGFSLCGPCGNFQRQVDYYSDFRTLFDYFFPGALPGDAIVVPDELIRNWQSVYLPKVIGLIGSNPETTRKLLSVTKAPYDENDPATVVNTVTSVLWYNVFTTRDGVRKLGGQPLDNRRKIYYGTGSFREDLRLNGKVKRYAADPAAATTIRNQYETTGNIDVPLVIAHTTKDPIQLFWHLPLYANKVNRQGRPELFTGVPVARYGHCTFTQTEILAGLSLLFLKVTGQPMPLAQQLMDAGSNNGVLARVATVEQK